MKFTFSSLHFDLLLGDVKMFQCFFCFSDSVVCVLSIFFQPMGNTQNHAPPFTLPPPPQFPGQHSHPGGSYPAQGGSYPAPPAGSYPAAGGGIPGGPPPLPNQPPNAMTGSAPPHISTQPPAGSVQPPPPAGYYDPHNAQNTAVRIDSFT